jgi:anti-sigma-K factor RskA
MNDVSGCQHIRQLLGVYVLGAIDPAERAQVDAHLAGCAECREELAALAGLPALLGRVPFGEAARIAGVDSAGLPGGEPGAGPLAAGGEPDGVVVLDSLMDRMAQDRLAERRRMNRWRGVLAAAAVALIAAGAALGIAHTNGGGRPAVAGPHWQTVQVTDAGTHARVVVKYAAMPWGTSLDTEVYGIPAGTNCEFWVIGSDGQKWQAGSWRVASTWQGTWYRGSSWVPVGAVHGFEITSGQKVLVHLSAT